MRDPRVLPNTFPRRTKRAAIEAKNSAGRAICASQPLLWADYSGITPGASTVSQFINS